MELELILFSKVWMFCLLFSYARMLRSIFVTKHNYSAMLKYPIINSSFSLLEQVIGKIGINEWLDQMK